MKLLNLLFEGKVDDFKNIFTDKFKNKNYIDAIIKVSSETNSKHKYLIWLGKTLTKPTKNNEVSFAEELSKAQELLFRFNIIGSNLPIKDITQYQTLSELSDAIQNYDNRQRRKIKKVDGADIIYDDDDYTVVIPNTYNASCFYGKGSKWCTASDVSSDQWYSHNKEGKLFYFLSKKLNTSNDFYKVALEQKYDGKRTFYNAEDKSFTSGWILDTDYFNGILSIIDDYMNQHFSKEINIFKDAEKAKKERERLANIERQARINRKISEANDRRENNEWDPNEINHGYVGSHAWALLTYILENENNVKQRIPNYDERMDFINSELDRLSELQSQYEAEGRDLTDINANISSFEDEKDELEHMIDVYNMIPEGSSYGDMTRFSVLHPDFEGYEYTVGDEDQINNAAYEQEESIINDIGIKDSFRSSFLEGYIDADAVGELADDLYRQWVYDNPESYLTNEDRVLSRSQEKELSELEDKLMKYTNYRNIATKRQEEIDPDNSKWSALEKGIDKLTDLINDLEYEIGEIKENPDGDWDESAMDEKIDELVESAKDDPLEFLKEFGFDDFDRYIDQDALIKGVIENDGFYSILNSYDGTGDEVMWDGVWYHIMNTDR